MKHIESILPENVADELTRFLSDDATILSSLKDLLHRDTGCDIPSLDNVPTSDIEEIIPLCLSILRRFWDTPLTALGDGTNKKSLADTFKRLVNNRVQGNEAWSIPTVNENIPSAVSALTKRHIDDGLTLTLSDGTTTSLPDGLSLAQLLCGNVRDFITLLNDSNIGWDIIYNIPSYLQNGETLTLGCKYAIGNIVLANNNPDLKSIILPYFEGLRPDINNWRNPVTIASGCPNVTSLFLPNLRNTCAYQFTFAIFGFDHIEEVNLPNYEKLLTEYGYGLVGNCPSLKKLYAPKYTYNNSYSGIFKDMPALEEADLSGLTSVAGHNYYGYGGMNNCPELHTLKLGVLTACDSYAFVDDPKLVRLEIAGAVGSINFSGWAPTTALAERLDEFLYNFQTYIANRVADMTGQTELTLTLSSAVYAALEAQEGQTILATLASKNWNVAQA